jgi:cyclophilin family peptidyl-prolyl cis-trans isomerase
MIALPIVLLLAQSAGPAPSPSPAASARPVVALETSLGTIKIALDRDKAPVTVENFLQYVRSGHYDGTIFHRVIPNFMIQGGGFDANMKQKPTRPPIKNEARNGLKNRRGTVAMARTNDPDSATSQFFINVKDNTMLDYGMRNAGYAVFGEVVEGMDVVERILAVPTTTRPPHADVPRMPVVIKSAREEGGPRPVESEAPPRPKRPKASPHEAPAAHESPAPHQPAKHPSPHP